jgi:hypothetical protein
MKNLIYDFALQGSVRLKKRKASDAAEHREPLAFAQLGKQTRAEFLPLYLARKSIRLSPEEVATYFLDQFPEKSRDYTGTVIAHTELADTQTPLDLEPSTTLQLANASPLLSIRFSGPPQADGSDNIAAVLDRALTASRQPGWKGIIWSDTGVRMITVEPQSKKVTVFVIKYSWISVNVLDHGGDAALLASLGLSGGQEWIVVVNRAD